MSAYKFCSMLAAFALTAGALALSSAPALAVGEANQAQCPNEALRSELGDSLLPDCRAWEQVSPAYKEGYRFGLVGFSADGEHGIGYSLGALAGTTGDTESASQGVVYRLSRTSVGWESTPLNPAASEYPGQELLHAEPTSGASLWLLHTPSQAPYVETLFIRSPTGQFTPVGPYTYVAPGAGHEPSSFILPTEDILATATSDYRHILIGTGARTDSPLTQIWPWDESAEKALYEYEGVGNSEPRAVGVRGTGRGNRELISRCGTYLGSINPGEQISNSGYGALSGDGSVVFFTPDPEDVKACGDPTQPKVAEVYARIDGERTVNVSTRSPSECTTTECLASPAADKNFEGASEDGSKVFFTSTQQLTDGADEDLGGVDEEGFHPDSATTDGGCAETVGAGGCNLYEFDLDAAHEHEAPGYAHSLKLIAANAQVQGVARISRDGSRVYFVAKGVLSSTPDEYGATAEAGADNLYVYDTRTRTTTFVAPLSAADASAWSAFDRRPFQTSYDGGYALFVSSAPLTPDVTSSKQQLFLFDAGTGELVRVSRGEEGYDENGNGGSFGVTGASIGEGANFGEEDDESAWNSLANLAVDTHTGTVTVAFETEDQLSPRAVSAAEQCISTYEFRSTESLGAGSVHLISDGKDTQPVVGRKCKATYDGIDEAGEDIFVSTADPLAPSDTDGVVRDFYDARVGGGFASPAQPGECQLEACHGSLSPTPLAAVAQSALQSPGENTSASTPGPAAKPKSLTRAQKLAAALQTCKRRPRNKRPLCEKRARQKYAPAAKAKPTSRRDR